MANAVPPRIIKLYELPNYQHFVDWGYIGYVGDTFYFTGQKKQFIKNNLQGLFPGSQIVEEEDPGIFNEDPDNPLIVYLTILHFNENMPDRKIIISIDLDYEEDRLDRPVIKVKYSNPGGEFEENLFEQIKDAILEPFNQVPQNGGRRKKSKSRKSKKTKKSKKTRKGKH